MPHLKMNLGWAYRSRRTASERFVETILIYVLEPPAPQARSTNSRVVQKFTHIMHKPLVYPFLATFDQPNIVICFKLKCLYS